MRLPLFISMLIIEKVGLSATGPVLFYWNSPVQSEASKNVIEIERF